MYVVHKADGMTLAGGTEEHGSGFSVATTASGLDEIMESAVRIASFLAEAMLIHHVAGLPPGSPDGLPLLGPVPGSDGLYVRDAETAQTGDFDLQNLMRLGVMNRGINWSTRGLDVTGAFTRQDVDLTIEAFRQVSMELKPLMSIVAPHLVT